MISSSCKQFKTGDGGLQYKIVKDAGAPKAQTGDVLSVHMHVVTDRDSTLDNTNDRALPSIIQIYDSTNPQAYPGDYNTMFSMLGEGDSAVFKLDLDTMASRTGQPKPEFADKYIIFKVKVNKVFAKGDLTDSVMSETVNTYYEGLINTLKENEQDRIDAYISKNKLKTIKTASGLQYIIEKEGEGEKITPGDSAVVNYTGGVIGGKVFDTSVKEVAEKENIFNSMRTYEPATFPVGINMSIPGFDEGLLLMNKGSKFKLIIPSVLGYGESGYPGAKIPHYAPLVFDVELLDIKKGVPPAPTVEQP